MFGRKLVIVITLLITFAVITGCSSVSKSAPAKLSKEEKAKLIQQLNAAFIDRYPDSQGIVKVYGELNNKSNRHVISATVAASDVPTEGKSVIYGTVVIENIEPGESETFDIVTGRGIGDLEDNIILSVTDAEFR